MSLEKLAEKINSAANAEADEIINSANEQASEIINSAKNEAQKMEDNATEKVNKEIAQLAVEVVASKENNDVKEVK